ncbi:ABC transporter ATP-binding protein [Rhodobium gokarnense]|uniref:ABC-type multidrug transport system fused ATPase/permease subunit n=1 Tax=Rhodobium gokarnense TaxID=364296 RepID=A0ABT3H5P5_9HYPH|nr:ABC transporter ATP-binding protein [Rhodobium gokarnense]MCW2305717.1 ABC-type multidrug transport system fused ATPase/permease subunit [Rhodobium gokarnense]
MLGRFERIVDPLRPPEALEPPARLGAFIWHYARQAKWWFGFFFLNGALIAATELMLYTFVGDIVDLLGTAEPATLWQEHGSTFLWMIFVVLVLRSVAQVAGALLEQQIIVPGFFNLVRWQAHSHVVGQSFTYFQNDFAGRLATKVMQAGQALGDFLINIFQSLWYFVIFAISTFAIFLDLDWRLGIVVGVWIAGYIAIGGILIPRIRRAARRLADMRSVFNGRIVDAYTNIHTVKLFDTTGHEDAFAREGLTWMWQALCALTRIISSIRFSLVALNGLFLTVSGFLCVWLWQAGTLTVGAVALALGLVLRLNTMSGWMMFSISNIFRDLGTIQDAMETIAKPHDIIDREDAVDLVPTSGRIEFDRISFHYGKDTDIIEDLSLTIAPGEKVGLVGRSGAGKSTLVNLLLRLFDLEGGRILIDGTDISRVAQESLRAAIGMVTQDTSLLHRSVRDNIAYGAPGADDAAILRAAEMAEADGFIRDLVDPKGRQGFDAHVGERGVKLSGGQRQRIAIARVLLKNAPILVLDEATSALDSEVEAAIQKSLGTLMEGKTVIAIAHRLSTIAAMDRLVVMDRGQIVEEGRHEELLALGGLYASLWARQSGGFLCEDEAENAAQ